MSVVSRFILSYVTRTATSATMSKRLVSGSSQKGFDTIALHGGYDPDPNVLVGIGQVGYAVFIEICHSVPLHIFLILCPFLSFFFGGLLPLTDDREHHVEYLFIERLVTFSRILHMLQAFFLSLNLGIFIPDLPIL